MWQFTEQASLQMKRYVKIIDIVTSMMGFGTEHWVNTRCSDYSHGTLPITIISEVS